MGWMGRERGGGGGVEEGGGERTHALIFTHVNDARIFKHANVP